MKQNKDYGEKQYHIKRLEGYRAFVNGVKREDNWYSPVRPNSIDEQGWFDGWDLAKKDSDKKQPGNKNG